MFYPHKSGLGVLDHRQDYVSWPFVGQGKGIYHLSGVLIDRNCYFKGENEIAANDRFNRCDS